ncbi:triphosphoribosyl-dephospho-CoA synthase [Moorella sp. Hama-1]|uniref:triphosphoribosyl-dephospho-CoA synthase n=1 Tax=Moorella sp. Hama-1 TaxID=2138101 RepID=UPI0013796757|nr:triphosphoribosyl-dephospho-CoA synthase [Moorella sp. Hama-1]BCV21935.1 triphosphoribosyl-dephospho-CoA synthase [Moorella sp. Hama-1]
MPEPDFRWDIAWSGQAACILEAAAPKVGNVNRFHDFTDCSLEDFFMSALALGQPLGRVHRQGVGRTVLRAITATRRAVASNTNLGMVLLMVPLAKAWGQMTGGDAHRHFTKMGSSKRELMAEVKRVLNNLTVEDAREVYQAIRLAAPAGMGRVENHDIYQGEEPNITLLEAMRLAADWDLIAREYATGFRLTLEIGGPALIQGLQQGLGFPEAIAQTHLYLLSSYADTLIARKAGKKASTEVQERARLVWEAGGWLTTAGRAAIAQFDSWLRRQGKQLNPGTTADITAAALFWLLLEGGPEFWQQMRSSADARRQVDILG